MCFRIWYEIRRLYVSIFFFFNDTATTEIYTLSLHDALPISYSTNGRYDPAKAKDEGDVATNSGLVNTINVGNADIKGRSEEHTSELQSRLHLVCRLLLEKKKQHRHTIIPFDYRAPPPHELNR